MTVLAWTLAGGTVALLTFGCATDGAWTTAVVPYCVAVFVPALMWLAYRYDRKGDR